jgi:hypothetical protein
MLCCVSLFDVVFRCCVVFCVVSCFVLCRVLCCVLCCVSLFCLIGGPGRERRTVSFYEKSRLSTNIYAYDVLWFYKKMMSLKV